MAKTIIAKRKTSKPTEAAQPENAAPLDRYDPRVRALASDLLQEIMEKEQQREREEREAETKAAEEIRAAKVQRPDVPRVKKQAIEGRLYDAGYALLAIRRLAIDAQDNRESAEWYLIAIEQLARSTFRGVDACIVQMSGKLAMGNFATEFDNH